MARARGRDVLLDVIEGIGALKLEIARHRERLDSVESGQEGLTAGFKSLAGATRALGGQMQAVAVHMNLVTERMNDLTERMNGVTERINEVTERVDAMTRLSERMQEELAEARRGVDRQSDIARDIADLLGTMAENTRKRIEDHEVRLLALEKKKAS